MATNLDIDQALLAEAQKLAGLRTIRATVNEALRKYIRHLRQLEAIEKFGQFDWDPDYDHKKERRRKRSGAGA